MSDPGHRYVVDATPEQDEPTRGLARADRRAELLAQLADLRGLRARLRPVRTRLDKQRAALRRNLGRH